MLSDAGECSICLEDLEAGKSPSMWKNGSSVDSLLSWFCSKVVSFLSEALCKVVCDVRIAMLGGGCLNYHIHV